MTSLPLDEFRLIERYFAPLARHPGAAELTDDVAVLTGHEATPNLILTVDAIVAGVHFLPDDPPADIAERALRVNLSDLAAKGARPIGYLLSLALSSAQDEEWIAGFAAGLAANQDEFHWSMLGGDTVATPGPLTISITAIGQGTAAAPPRRGGASSGDQVWVTGAVGDGALGLAILQGTAPALPHEAAAAAEARFRRPEPRVELGIALTSGGIMTASADVSDGLVADAGHIAAASGLRALLHADRVPLSAGGKAAVAADVQWLEKLLTGGDDYELVFTAASANESKVREAAKAVGIPITAIGTMHAGSGVQVVDAAGRPISLAQSGYTHR